MGKPTLRGRLSSFFLKAAKFAAALTHFCDFGKKLGEDKTLIVKEKKPRGAGAGAHDMILFLNIHKDWAGRAVSCEDGAHIFVSGTSRLDALGGADVIKEVRYCFPRHV